MVLLIMQVPCVPAMFKMEEMRVGAAAIHILIVQKMS